ncbi:unnamed protein product [Kuraishia capsulata CBS 1993]|uniref:Peroxin/Ferlin domain-containing protein n=1 Tax=Kuraishia capsulata CBS 1993 TaxID=1382522 RepID=W6MGF0_9ASCO|nr:uncharacterized protein KUCA_T00000838001 [Kuraishia capsulata CBS 1993]CDK24871.1 unnamed protein product [Kuraishia capsulata CBS 1993]
MEIPRIWDAHDVLIHPSRSRNSVTSKLGMFLTRSRSSELNRSITHLSDIRKDMSKLPQFNDIDELADLCDMADAMLNMTTTQRDAAQNHLFADSTEMRSKFDIIVENERGAMLFGIPMYSKNTLIDPFDPPKFQNIKGHEITDIKLFALPALGWKWSWPNWYVLMISDVDDQGWIYSSIRFKSQHWKGVARFGNFVRRRIWIRMREKVPIDTVLTHEWDNDEIAPTIEVGGIDSRRVRKRDRLKRKLGFYSTTADDLNESLMTEEASTVSNGSANSDEDSHQIADRLSPYLAPEMSNVLEDPISEMDDESRDPYAIIYQLRHELREMTVDRKRVDKLLESLLSFDNETLALLISDFKTSLELSTASFLAEFYKGILFRDSKRLFLKAFQENIPMDDSERSELLNQIFEVYRDDLG